MSYNKKPKSLLQRISNSDELYISREEMIAQSIVAIGQSRH